MTKLYSRKNEFSSRLKLKPKKETILFLLEYSRVLCVIDTPLGEIEVILN